MSTDDAAPWADDDAWDRWFEGDSLDAIATAHGVAVVSVRDMVRGGAPFAHGGDKLVQGGRAVWIAAVGMTDGDGVPREFVFLRVPRAYPASHLRRAVAVMGRDVATRHPGARLDPDVVEDVDLATCEGMATLGYPVYSLDDEGEVSGPSKP